MTEFTSHRRILVVDDNRDAASTLAAVLGNLGHTVVEAYDGSAAVDLAGDFRPELVLLDLQMPVMDGFDVIRELRVQERRRGSKMIVIALSGHADAAHLQATSEEGFDGHLVKPLELDKLTRLAESLIEQPTQ